MNITLNSYDYANIFTIYQDSDGLMYFNLIDDLNIGGTIDPSLYDEIYYNDENNWYSLSNTFYGTPRLWWIILIANNIDNPCYGVKVGDKIKILKKEAVSEILSQLNISNNE